MSAFHWRKARGSECATLVGSPRVTVVASACGRLVDYQEAVGDRDEVSCTECLLPGEMEAMLRRLSENFYGDHDAAADDIEEVNTLLARIDKASRG